MPGDVARHRLHHGHRRRRRRGGRFRQTGVRHVRHTEPVSGGSFCRATFRSNGEQF